MAVKCKCTPSRTLLLGTTTFTLDATCLDNRMKRTPKERADQFLLLMPISRANFEAFGAPASFNVPYQRLADRCCSIKVEVRVIHLSHVSLRLNNLFTSHMLLPLLRPRFPLSLIGTCSTCLQQSRQQYRISTRNMTKLLDAYSY